jgi:hypothetical protein
MPSFEGVAAGQTATCRLPIGQTYHQLLVSYSGVTLSQINGVRLIANGKAIHTYQSLGRLDSMNQFDGRSAANGIMVLDLERFGLEGRTARELTAIGTGIAKDPTPITTLSLELDIDAAAVSPALSAKAVRSAPTPAGFVKKIRRFSYSATGAGDYEIADLPKGELIDQVFFFGAGINRVDLSRDNYQEFVRTAEENSLIQSNGVRVPQAGVFVYDPTEHSNGSETLATSGVHDLRFTLNMAAAANIDVVVVYIGALMG